MGQFTKPNAAPVKTPDAANSMRPKYLEGYNTAFDNNVGSKTIDQDLQATRTHASNVNKYADNDTMDYYKGQSDALQDLSNHYNSQPKSATPVTQPTGPTMQQSSIPKKTPVQAYKSIMK